MKDLFPFHRDDTDDTKNNNFVDAAYDEQSRIEVKSYYQVLITSLTLFIHSVCLLNVDYFCSSGYHRRER